MDSPLVCGLCLTYGRVSYLEEAIQAFLEQDYPNKRLLVFNTFLPQKLHGDFKDVKIVNAPVRPPNLGACRNAAIELLPDDAICVIWDDDDNYLKCHLGVFAKHFEDGIDWVRLSHQWYVEAYRIRKIVPGTCNVVAFRRSAWAKVGGYPNRDCGEDRDFFNKLTKLPGKNAQIAPQEIGLLYSWANGVYHTSGMGDDHPGRATGHDRIAHFTMQQARLGNIPTGDIQLRPALLHNYEQMAKEFLASTVVDSKKNEFVPVKVGQYPPYTTDLERLKPWPSITILYITVPTDIEHCAKLASRFCESYVKCPPGLPHETVVVCNGAPPGYTARKCFTSIPNVKFFEHDDSGWDIGAFLAYAKVCTTDLLVCFGGQGYVKRGGWLARLVEAWKKHGPGMYGTLASYEVSPHLNTTGFMCEPHWLVEYPWPVVTRVDRYSLEHGPKSLWRLVVQRGGQALLVTWDDELSWPRWREPKNGFRANDQSDCLTYFKHTHIFDSTIEPMIRNAMKASSDTMTDETFIKARRDRDFRLQHIGSDASHFAAVHYGEEQREAAFRAKNPLAK